MGFFDNAHEAIDRGMASARGAVSGVAVEQLGFVKHFARTCQDGWEQGWHEANGGNLSYRMTEADASSARSFFYDNPSSWVPMGVQAECLKDQCFLVTASGCQFRNVARDIGKSVGIIETNTVGSAWRIVWGFKDGGMPTSEISSHMAAHAVRMAATDGAMRVVYHCHAPNVISMGATMESGGSSREFTRALWKTMTECIMAFPEGIGMVAPSVPGSAELAASTNELMQSHAAVVWAQHGLVCTGIGFDETFGLAHSVEKAAGMYLSARAACGGQDPRSGIDDELLRSIACQLGLSVREDWLS